MCKRTSWSRVISGGRLLVRFVHLAKILANQRFDRLIRAILAIDCSTHLRSRRHRDVQVSRSAGLGDLHCKALPVERILVDKGVARKAGWEGSKGKKGSLALDRLRQLPGRPPRSPVPLPAPRVCLTELSVSVSWKISIFWGVIVSRSEAGMFPTKFQVHPSEIRGVTGSVYLFMFHEHSNL